jgi:hypothetical protein
MFIPDPDLDFLPIPDLGSRGQKGTRSQIRIRNSAKKQCFGPGDPPSNRAKMTKKKGKKFYYLKRWLFSLVDRRLLLHLKSPS